MVYDVLRRPARRPGQVRSADRRQAIVRLRERYRPLPRVWRIARRLLVVISILLLVQVTRQPGEAFPAASPADPADYADLVARLQEVCADAFCEIDAGRPSHSDPAVYAALWVPMREVGARFASYNPWTGDARIAPHPEGNLRYRTPTPTAAQAHARAGWDSVVSRDPRSGEPDWVALGGGWSRSARDGR